MVIDANTGTVLHQASADQPRYPASLTKMMTLYLLFEEIERGRIGLTSKIRMSEIAAAAPPSKLGVPAGDEIEVVDAIRALIVKSANDVAVAVAEHIGGSEPAFARMMTEKARLLGMSQTTFRNSSGLPNREQVTTARDMLTLALRLQDDFPKFYYFFGARTFTYRGQTHRNHNSMLGTFPGMDGLKTGYIRMSGFNVVSSVKRGDRHVVAAVFGGATATSRNAELRALLGRTLPKASTLRTRRPAPVISARATPVRPAERGSAQVASARPPAQPAPAAAATAPAPSAHEPAVRAPAVSIARVRPVAIAPAAEAPARTLDAEPASTGNQGDTSLRSPVATAQPSPARALGLAPSSLNQQAENLARGVPPLSRVAPPPDHPVLAQQPVLVSARAAAPAAHQPSAAEIRPGPGSGGFHIQVGAYASAAEAEKALVSALERASALLARASPLTEPVQRGGRQLFRARFGGFDQQAAASACQELRRRQIDCFVARAE